MPAQRLAIISSQAFSVHNFRGPLIRELVARGIHVVAFAPDYDAHSRAAVAALGAEPVSYSLSRAAMNPARDLLDTIALARLLRRLRPDLTLAYFIKPVIYGCLAAAVAGVPRRFALVEGLGYVFTIEGGGQSLPRRLLRTAVSRLYAVALGLCERVFLLNKDDAEWFVSNGLIDAEKVVCTNGIGIDLNAWRPAPLPPSPPVFLLIARLIKEKGIHDFIEAARQVKVDHPAARFVLVGGPDLNPSALTRGTVEEWVREGLVEWPGEVIDVRPWIERASVFVLPSYYREGVPRSTLEAMSMGRPVITTRWVGCKDTVVDEVNGFLVPARNPDAIAAAMRRFIEEPALVARMGRESRRLAEERFDVHTVNAVILNAMRL